MTEDKLLSNIHDYQETSNILLEGVRSLQTVTEKKNLLNQYYKPLISVDDFG